jgi:hypothetical protein
LTWKAQLINVMNKACRAFWTCKDTFGKSYGLKPRMLSWICSMVVRPFLAFVSMVWWLRVRFDVSRMERNKLQSLTCLATTEAMKVTPTAAVEIIVGLTLCML